MTWVPSLDNLAYSTKFYNIFQLLKIETVIRILHNKTNIDYKGSSYFNDMVIFLCEKLQRNMNEREKVCLISILLLKKSERESRNLNGFMESKTVLQINKVLSWAKTFRSRKRILLMN